MMLWKLWNPWRPSQEQLVRDNLQRFIALAEQTPDEPNNPNIVEVEFFNADRRLRIGKIIFRIAGVTGETLSMQERETYRYFELILYDTKKPQDNIRSSLGAFGGTYMEILKQLKQEDAAEILLKKIKEKAGKLHEG